MYGLLIIELTVILLLLYLISFPLFWGNQPVCPFKTILQKLFSKLPFVTQCLTQVEIIEVHWTVMASYLLNLISMTDTLYLIMYVPKLMYCLI